MAGEYEQLLKDHPVFARAAEDFLILHDAAQILDDRQVPCGGVATPFLRETARAIAAQAGMPDEFIDAMTRARPPR